MVRVELVPDGAFQHWIDSLRNAEAIVESVAEPMLAKEMGRFFNATQDAVHVITGELKASGRVASDMKGGVFEGRVLYDADYASYEHDRGGSHAFLDRGWEMTEADFSAAVDYANDAIGRAFGA